MPVLVEPGVPVPFVVERGVPVHREYKYIPRHVVLQFRGSLMPITKQLMCLLMWVSIMSGCAQHSAMPVTDTPSDNPKHQFTANERFNRIADAEQKHDKDIAAILAMQGDFKVGFDFRETVILAENYSRYPVKQTGALETVVLVEQTPNHVVLQHSLVVGDGHVIKHWRQDWHYQATERFEFTSDQKWTVEAIPEDRHEGYWTQCVYEVSDAPRYCGTGRWNHNYGVSTWTSDRTWRPLPRREYTVRDDYNALNVENRHTVTPQGWTHEQDNTKTLRIEGQAQKTLVREFGFNDYRNIKGADFTPAFSYWEKTKGHLY